MSLPLSVIYDLKSEYSHLTRSEKWLYCLYTFLLINQVLNLFRAVENRIGLGALTDYSNAIFITIALLGSITIFRERLRLGDFIFVIALGIFHQLSINIHPETALIASENAELFLWSCLPMYLVGRTVNFKTSSTLFVGLSYIALFMQFLFLYVLGVEENELGEIELMGTAYGFLPFVLFLIWYAIERKGLFNIAVAVIAAFLLLSMGTRGPVMCMVAFIALYLIIFRKMRTIYKVLLFSGAIILNSFMAEIMLLLSVASSSLGLSTRVFDHFQDGQMVNLQESNGRDVIWKDAWDYLMSHDRFWGEGLYSDRMANMLDGYAHNLEVELLCDFGLIGGSIILAILLWLVYKSARNTWHTDSAVILLVFFCSAFLFLQFSSSFLQAPIFWFFLGVCVTFSKYKSIANQ